MSTMLESVAADLYDQIERLKKRLDYEVYDEIDKLDKRLGKIEEKPTAKKFGMIDRKGYQTHEVLSQSGYVRGLGFQTEAVSGSRERV